MSPRLLRRRAAVWLLAVGLAAPLAAVVSSALSPSVNWPSELWVLPLVAPPLIGLVTWRCRPESLAAWWLLLLSVVLAVHGSLPYVLALPLWGRLRWLPLPVQFGSVVLAHAALVVVVAGAWIGLGVVYPERNNQRRAEDWALRLLAGLAIAVVLGEVSIVLLPAVWQARLSLVGFRVAVMTTSVLAPGAFLVLLAARYRRSGREQRRQLAWPLGVGSLVALTLGWLMLPVSDWPLAELLPIGFRVALIAVPLAGAIGLLCPRWLDAEAIARPALAAGGLALALALLGYGMASVAAGRSRPLPAPQTLLVVTVLTVARPARARVQRLVGRLVFGDQPSRYKLVRGLGHALASARDLDAMAHGAAEIVREGLYARWVVLSLPVYGLTGTALAPQTNPLTDELAPAELEEPLTHDEEVFGTLSCGPRLDGGYTGADADLLATLARQVALALHNAPLARAGQAGRADRAAGRRAGCCARSHCAS